MKIHSIVSMFILAGCLLGTSPAEGRKNCPSYKANNCPNDCMVNNDNRCVNKVID